jgi:hypothetical protein
MFTEEDSKRQDAEFEALKNEFVRLEQQEKALRKAAGLPENGEVKVNDADITPEVRQALEEAKASARREGEARATQYRNGTASGAAGKPAAGRGRQGVIRA